MTAVAEAPQLRPWSSRVPGWRALSPFARDCVGAGALVALGLLGLVVPLDDGESTTRSMDVLGLALMLATAVPVAWRRVKPAVAASAAAAASVTYTALDYQTSGTDVALLVLLYSVAAYSPRRRAVLVAGVLIVAMVGQMVLLLALGRAWVSAADPFAVAVFLILPALVGDNRRMRRAYVASLVERAEQADLVRRLEADRAVADERARIARELHDVVAHHVTGIVVFAGAAERHTAALPDQVQRSLAQIRSSGTDALTAMRELVTVLRAADGAFGTHALRELVDRVRATGADVRLDIAADLALPAGEAGTCVYRCVQESLTNAAKYAAGAPVTVTITGETITGEAITGGAIGDAGHIDVRVDNAPPPGSTGVAAVPSGGHGLIGMRERVEAVGGTLTAGPTSSGGWSVHARVPVLAGADR